MMKKLLMLTILISTLILSGCGANEVDISKYIEINESGYDRYGNVQLYLNSDFYEDRSIFKDTNIDYSNLKNFEIKVVGSNEKNLKNNDVIEVSIEYDEKLYKDELGIKLKNTKEDYTISKLDKALLVQSDLNNDDYVKFKQETLKKSQIYIDSKKESKKTYTEIEFVDAFIKNPVTSIDKNKGNTLPTLLYLYKVNETITYSIMEPTNNVNYIFVPVEAIILNDEGKVNTYVIPDISNYNNIKSYSTKKLPDIDSIKGEYISDNDYLEKIVIDVN